MIRIEYPPYQPKIKESGSKTCIFDEFRKQWVVLTPEEWVRQNFLHFLVRVMKYPASLIAVEKEIKMNDVTRRFDVLVYNKEMQPWMIIECKEMNVALTENVLSQALRYNINLQVAFIVITNGSHCYGFSTAGENFNEIDVLPVFPT